MMITDQIELAKNLHRQGLLDEASEIYLALLKEYPEHADAMHLMGLIAAQNRNPRLAIDWISKALHIEPANPKFHNNLATAYLDIEDYPSAVNAYDKAIQCREDYVDAYFNKGIALIHLKKHDLAIQAFKQAISLDSNFAEALILLGNSLKEVGRVDEAIDSYAKAESLTPENAGLLYNLGNAYKAQNEFKLAIKQYDKCIAIAPDFIGAYVNRGVVLKELGSFEEALASQEQAILIDGKCAEAYLNSGNVLKELGRFEEAIVKYEHAITNKTDYIEAYLNRGVSLEKLNRSDEAIANFEKAISIKNDYVEAYFNKGSSLEKSNRFDEAIACYEKAISIKDDYADAYWNKSLVLLLKGQLSQGWSFYEWRWRIDKGGPEKRPFSKPMLQQEEDIQGKTILLHAEQGLGDTLQFIRYVPMVIGLGAKVVLEVQESLFGFFQGMHGISRLLKRGDPLPAFDLHCPLLSLPHVFKTELSSIPSPSYFPALKETKLKAWRDRLGMKSKPRIGLVWSGSTLHKNDQKRSLSPSMLQSYLPKEIDFFCLQKEVRDTDADILKLGNIHCLNEQIVDFTDTAALCDLMDLVISVDTSVAHLAGSQGKSTWLLLPFIPDWRWLLDRDDSPWYPSVKIYRQTSMGDWDSVLQKVRNDLLARFADHHY
jgi:tetratricopeptide (TPR) repeat protein